MAVSRRFKSMHACPQYEQALVDSRFRTLCCALANHYYRRLYACAAMRKMTSSTIPEIHNMLQCGQWRIEPRPHNNFVKMGHMDNVVQKLLLVDCRQTRKSTHKTRLCNASLHRRKRLEEIFLNVKTCSSQANNSSMVYRPSMAVFPVGPIAIIPRCVDDMFWPCDCDENAKPHSK